MNVRTEEFTRRVKDRPPGVEANGHHLEVVAEPEPVVEPEIVDAAPTEAERIADLERALGEAQRRERDAAGELARLERLSKDLERTRARLKSAESRETSELADARAEIVERERALAGAGERIATLERQLLELRTTTARKPRTPDAPAAPAPEEAPQDMLGRPRAGGGSVPPGVARSRVPDRGDSESQALASGLLRRRWLILACAVVVAAIAFVRASGETKQYQASSSLLFQSGGAAQQFLGVGAETNPNAVTREANTNARLVSLPDVSVRTAAALHNRVSSGEVASAVAATPAASANVVTLNATARTPQLAADIANTYAAEYVNFSRDGARAPIVLGERSLKRQVARTSDPGLTRALNQRLAQLETLSALQTGNAKVVDLAQPPSSASSPKPVRDAALGLLAGLMLGILIAVPLELLDRALRKPNDVARIFGVPVLARVPVRGRGRHHDDGAAEEAFRTLQTNLRYLDVEKPLESVLVTSPGREDGKSTVARQLVETAARSGTRALLVDAGTGAADGLGPAIAGISKLDDVITPAGPDHAHYDVLPAGLNAPNQQALLESRRMHELMRTLDERYDLVVVDGPPASHVSQVLPWIELVGGVVVVCRLGVTFRGAARQVQRVIGRVRTPLLGVVINGVESRASAA